MERVCGCIATSPISISIGRKYEAVLREILREIDPSSKWIGIVHEPRGIEGCELLVVLIATGGTEHIVLKLSENTRYMALIYHRYNNSLPALLEVLPVLREKELFIELIPYTGDQRELREELKKLVKAYRVVKELQGLRLGIVGGISDWLVYSRVDPDRVREKLGIDLVYVPLKKIYNEYKRTSVSENEYRDLVEKARRIKISSDNIRDAYKLYKAISKIIEEYGLAGYTIKCFDLIPVLNTTACLAVSLMNTSGRIIAGCEGDVPSMLTMLLLNRVSNKPVFMGNIAWINRESVLIAHCTAPIISEYKLYTHFESDKGVGISVEYPIGEKVTIARLSPDLEMLRAGIGEIVETKWSTGLCRTQVKIKLRNPKKIIRESIGNHYALVVGDYLEPLKDIARFLDIKVDEI
ncbi:MAG: hypothetical protein ABWW65_02410 [Thermoprotei archaeon]